ncbi:MAG: hydroxyacylglutathione hydrolase [Solirubrobacteraceae bacterium]|jgi:glyoxylase-like metal-dependent hydrolase (beta-lactamase superfamily II)|nr:hydroxyacylglutathione hydrolase [Solirubrobacteraceae bacterium]
MIIERTEHPDWLSNAYLVGDEPGGTGVFIDGNDRVEPLIEAARANDLTIAAVLLTHHHHDHLAGLERLSEEFGAPILAHDLTAREVDGVDRTLIDDEVVTFGGLDVKALFTPGHAPGHLAFLVNGTDVFTADVLFKGTVGGTLAPGATGFEDLKASVERLLELPGETVIHPGHTLPTTVAEERESNPFFRIWSGKDREGSERCTVRGEPATLVLWAPDYDGTNKAWVRFDDGRDAIVGGSQVTR